jgi:hypothetical protein
MHVMGLVILEKVLEYPVIAANSEFNFFHMYFCYRSNDLSAASPVDYYGVLNNSHHNFLKTVAQCDIITLYSAGLFRHLLPLNINLRQM